MKAPTRNVWLLGALAAIVVAASLSIALSHETTPGNWTWSAKGILRTHSKCSKQGRAQVPGTCQFQVANPPKTKGEVRLDVRVHNIGAVAACYGLSITTSYLAGLQSFCDKAGAYGSYVIKNRAEYYIDFTLDLFVSVDSKGQPLTPIAPNSPSPFRVTFSETHA